MSAVTEKSYDVVVVGGGAAGLSAALTLARARRRVVVVDAGQPRNAPAEGVHALLGLDGIAPQELLARGRQEVIGYRGEIISGRVTEAAERDDGFAVTLEDGERLCGRRLLIATGLVDDLPQIPGVREQWGRNVIHCPYCHGWEVRDRALGILGTSPMSVHQTLLFRQWSPDVVYFTHRTELGEEARHQLDARGIGVVEGTVASLPTDQGRLVGVRLDDGRLVARETVVVTTRLLARAEVFAALGVRTTSHPMGEFVEADPTGRTPIAGVWVAGNATDLFAQVGAAAADGARVGAHINADLITEETERAVAAARRTPVVSR